jgi:hypothetical protein
MKPNSEIDNSNNKNQLKRKISAGNYNDLLPPIK